MVQKTIIELNAISYISVGFKGPLGSDAEFEKIVWDDKECGICQFKDGTYCLTCYFGQFLGNDLADNMFGAVPDPMPPELTHVICDGDEESTLFQFYGPLACMPLPRGFGKLWFTLDQSACIAAVCKMQRQSPDDLGVILTILLRTGMGVEIVFYFLERIAEHLGMLMVKHDQKGDDGTNGRKDILPAQPQQPDLGPGHSGPLGGSE